MPRDSYKFTKRKRFAEPNNTGGLGTMKLIRYDTKEQVHEWKDADNSIWLTAPGKKYGHLVASTNQPTGLGENWPVTLPDGKQVRTLYLMDPKDELYEPLGTLPSPAQAQVTSNRGKILLTTSPLLLRIVHPRKKNERRWTSERTRGRGSPPTRP
jgi:hypothetical protein